MKFARSGVASMAILLLLIGTCAAQTAQAPARKLLTPPPSGSTTNAIISSPQFDGCPVSASQMFPVGSGYTFTPCGATGRTGPSQQQCVANGPSWLGNSNCGYSVNQGAQYLFTPQAGNYRFTVQGARGGSIPGGPMGGNAANVSAVANLASGVQIALVVGQSGRSDGQDDQGFTAGGGGGASYVFLSQADQHPGIVAAGGGGVSSPCSTFDNSHTTVNGFASNNVPAYSVGAGGIGKYGNGLNGDAGQLSPAAGGEGGNIVTGALGRSGGGGAAPISSWNNLPGVGGSKYAMGGFGGGGGGGWGGRFQNSCGGGGGGGGWIAGKGGDGEDDGGNVLGGTGGSSLVWPTGFTDVTYATMGYRSDQYDGSIKIEFLG